MKLRSSLSMYLISSAALFSRNAYAVEQRKPIGTSGQLWMDHRSFSIGAVVSSVMFLESAINELYLEAIDRNEHIFSGQSNLAELMSHLWETTEELPVLTKYQIALTLAQKPPFSKNNDPYQSVDAMIKLRNALVHYKPEWDTDLNVNEKLQCRLANKFDPNQFEDLNKPFFPHRCLGHGCAAWSVTTAIEFYTQFTERIGLPLRKFSNASGLAVQ